MLCVDAWPRVTCLNTPPQVATPIAAAPPGGTYVMTEAVPRAGRAAWEARMTALYGRAVHILEYTRSGEHRGAAAPAGVVA